MADVAQYHVGEVSRLHQFKRMTDSAPSFTAVNGASSPAPQSSTTADGGSLKKAVEEKSHLSQPLSSHQEPAKALAHSSMDISEISNMRPVKRLSPAPPLAPAPTPSAVLAPIQQSSSTHPGEQRNPPPSQQIANTEESRAQSVIKQTASVNTPQVPAVVMSSQKRKRSVSQERENPGNPALNQNDAPQSPRGSKMPNGVESGHTREHYSPQHAYPPPSDIYPPPSTDTYPPPPQHTYPPPPDQRGGHPDIYPRPNGLGRGEYDPPLDPSIAPSQERPYYSESHLAEALQRENRSYDAMPGRENYGSPEDDDDQSGQYGTYGGSRERDSQSVSEMDRKRRKRVFSNRTKTGCMTCRRRKKKCDEQHPECEFIIDFTT